MAKPTIVQPFEGEPLRFLVASRRPFVDPYLVDLEENRGNGWCACEDFQFRRQPRIDQAHPLGPETRCWHIKMARQYLVERVIRELSERGRPARSRRMLPGSPDNHDVSEPDAPERATAACPRRVLTA